MAHWAFYSDSARTLLVWGYLLIALEKAVVPSDSVLSDTAHESWPHKCAVAHITTQFRCWL